MFGKRLERIGSMAVEDIRGQSDKDQEVGA